MRILVINGKRQIYGRVKCTRVYVSLLNIYNSWLISKQWEWISGIFRYQDVFIYLICTEITLYKNIKVLPLNDHFNIQFIIKMKFIYFYQSSVIPHTRTNTHDFINVYLQNASYVNNLYDDSIWTCTAFIRIWRLKANLHVLITKRFIGEAVKITLYT